MNSELGFLLAGIAGLSLGLIGGGGSLLTVPILIYGFHVSAILGTAYALFTVGLTSFVGAVIALRRDQVVSKVVFAFALPSFVGIYLSRNFILHPIPERINFSSAYSLSRESILMTGFGLVMILAALLTLRQTAQKAEQRALPPALPYLIALGFGVGVITGLFGTGGGFLIVPALVLCARLPMEKAVGTSLAIIAANAWFGLVSDLGHPQEWNWNFVLTFSGCSLGGVLTGQYLSSRIPGTTLKTLFGWASLILGLGILFKEISRGFE